MVCVTQGKLPAKVIVAPNSPSARAQQMIATANSEGAISDSLRACNVSVEVTDCSASPHGVLTTRPTRGTTKKAAPRAARIAIQIGARSRLISLSAARELDHDGGRLDRGDRT